jgi:branched-chain amino acid transport system ATP-binding protein
MVLASVLLSELTKAWLLYLGLVFLFMVMYAPGGVASLIMMNLRVAALRQAAALWPYLALAGCGAAWCWPGRGAMIEMVYHLQLNAALGPSCASWGCHAQRQGAHAAGSVPGAHWPGPVRADAARVCLHALGRCAGPTSKRKSSAGRPCEFSSKAINERRRPKSMNNVVEALRAGTARPAQELRQDRNHPRRQPGRRRPASVWPSSGPTAPASHAVQPDQRALRPTSGEILLNGQPHQRPEALRDQPAGWRAASRCRNLFTRLSVFENLRCAVLWSLGYRYAFWKFLADLHDANDRADEVMDMIKLDNKRDTLAMNLTYAEQRALEIGITIAGGANVILLDEPTAGMSKSETKRFVELIREVTVGKTLLTVEHDMGVVFGLADKIAVLVYGEVIAFDTPEAVRANPRVQEAYLGSVLADQQAAGGQWALIGRTHD